MTMFWFCFKSTARSCLLLLSSTWEDLRENSGDFSPTVVHQSRPPWRRRTQPVFFFASSARDGPACFFTCASSVPRGRPGRPAAGTPSPEGPSAPSCWTPPPPPSPAPPSPAALSVARWFAPSHQREGKEEGEKKEARMSPSIEFLY